MFHERRELYPRPQFWHRRSYGHRYSPKFSSARRWEQFAPWGKNSIAPTTVNELKKVPYL
jgi:hypothetical protein